MSDFVQAIADYRYLRERDYSPRAALKLVGDHHELSARERNLLFRGVLPRALAGARAARLVSAADAAGRCIGVDWYNVLITVESYLKGIAVFVADDGLVRDAAAVHGSYRSGLITDQAIGVVVEAMRKLSPARADLLVDAPVAFSGQMAAALRDRLRGLPFASRVEVVESPDYALKGYCGVVASSDSAIIDRAAKVLDLARFALHEAFGFEPPDLAAVALQPQ